MEEAKKPPHTELERHYTLAQIAHALHVSESTVHRYFVDEPGVLKLGHPTRLAGRKYQRHYFSLRIPHSVFMRVLDKYRLVDHSPIPVQNLRRRGAGSDKNRSAAS
jgi:AraC-like DNA-binding protein